MLWRKKDGTQEPPRPAGSADAASEEQEELVATLELLEARVRQVVDALQALRRERDQARGELEKVRNALRERGETIRGLEARLLELQGEREDVRQRVEQLIARIDALGGEPVQ